MKIYLIAGEPSGDALGGRLIKALRQKARGTLEIMGIGGENMEREGLQSLFDISDLAIMGLAEVIPSIPKVLKRIKQTVDDIVKQKPDVVVTIDSWSFSARVHERLRKLKLGIPQVHYVAPQVWAWKARRAKTMHKYIDHLLTLLPQEAKYFTPYHLATTFVGHPVIESPLAAVDGDAFRIKYKVAPSSKIIAVLPGSRHNEVARLFPVFIEAARQMLEADSNFLFVVPTVHTVAARVKAMAAEAKLPMLVVEDVGDRQLAIKASLGAMAASGTVALELAIAGVPHIIAYKVAPITAWMVRRLVKVQFANLSNILLGREIVPELIQEKAVSANIKSHVTELLSKGGLYEKQMQGFEEVKKLLGFGQQMPSEKAADVILGLALKK